MKEKIHPNYVDCIVKCACGYSFQTKSTKPEILVDICGNCHPFFTGKQKLVDSAGRVEKFKKKFGEKIDITKERKVKKEKKTRVEKIKKTTEKILTSASKKKKK